MILGLLAIGTLLHFMLRGRRLWPVSVAMGASIVSGIVAVIDIADINPLATPGWGIIMVAVTSSVLVVATLLLWRGARSS